MLSRPKHSVSRLDYRQLADFKIPQRNTRIRRKDKIDSSPDSTFYRLRVLEEDKENRKVKVRYVGYSDNYDEWREIGEIMTMNEEESDNLAPFQQSPTSAAKFCLKSWLGESNLCCSPAERLTLFVLLP